MAHRPGDAGVLRADPGRHGGALAAGAQGLHPERGPGPAPRHHRDGRGHLVRRDGAATSRRPRRSCRRTRTSTGFMSAVGRAAARRPTNQGRFIIQLKPRTSGRSTPTRWRAQLTREAVGGAGHPGVLHQPAADQHRRALSRRATTSSRCRAPTSTQLYATEQKLEATLRGAAAARATSPATCRSRTRRSTSPSTATAPRRSASTAQQIEQALYNAYGARQVSTIYTANNQYWVVMELLPQYQRDLGAMRLLSVRGAERHAGAAHGAGHGHRDGRARSR